MRFLRRLLVRSAMIVVFAMAASVQLTTAASRSVTEDFSTTTRRDPATTARWDTATRRATLPTAEPAWFSIEGLRDRAVSAAAFSPSYADDRTVFVGVGDGVFRSTDGAVTWTRVTTTTAAVESIAPSPAFATDRTIFAITNGNGVYRSTDGGTTWIRVHEASGFALAVSPAFATDRTVFAATFSAILRSTDGGTTWESVVNGIDAEAIQNGDLRGVAVSGAFATDRTVFATAFSVGTYRSIDAGATWTLVNPAGIALPSASAIATYGATTVAAYFDGAYRSTDRGATWTKVADGDIEELRFAPEGTLLLATAQGVQQWANGSLSAVASGWSGGSARSVAVAAGYPSDGSVIGGVANGCLRYRRAFVASAVTASLSIDDTSAELRRATVQATAAVPAGTGVTYQLSAIMGTDGQPVWEGPVTLGTPWTFARSGSDLRWRATLTTTDPDATPAITSVTVAYEVPDPLVPPVPVRAVPSSRSIRWEFDDRASGETGYEMHAGAHGSGERVVATSDVPVAQGNAFVEETGLSPDREYCDRHVHVRRGSDRSPASPAFPCAATLAVAPAVPRVDQVTATTARLQFDGGENAPETTYAIRDERSARTVGADGAFGQTDLVWRTRVEWGDAVAIQRLAPETAYAFCVIARNRAGTPSTCSPSVTATTPARPVVRGETRIAITAPNAVTPMVRGGEFATRIRVEGIGEGSASDVVASLPIPGGARYVPGSLTESDRALTDVRDTDSGDHDITSAGAVTFRVGTLASGEVRTFDARVRIAEDAGASIAFDAQVTFRPLPDLAIVSRAAPTLTVGVAPRAAIGSGPPPEPSPPAASGGSTTDTLTITEPAEGVVVTGGDVAIRGVVVPVQAVHLALDGGPPITLTPEANGSFATTLQGLAVGEHTLVVRGTAAALVRHVTIAPAIPLAILTPEEGAAFTGSTLLVRGVSPASTRVAIIVDDQSVGEAVSDGSGTFVITSVAPFTEGPHVLTASAVVGGQALTVRRVFSIDRTPPSAPTITEISLPERTPSASDPNRFDVILEVRGSILVGDFPTVEAILITVSSEPVTFAFIPRTPTWVHRVAMLLESGPHTIRIAARDRAGNITVQPETIPFEVPPAACGNGRDDDGDGQVDFPSDPECAAPTDGRESPESVLERTVTAVTSTAAAAGRTVARTTTQAARVTARAAERVAIATQERVLDNPTVEVATERVVAPVVAVAVVANTATAVQGVQLLAYLQHLVGLLLQPGRLLARRRRKAWGTVYASLTKRPIDLALVRLVDAVSGKVVQTAVTDGLGRFSFHVRRAGRYRVEVRHPAYTFPSTLLTGRREDAAYIDCYFGEERAVTEEDAFLVMNIPLDAHEVPTEAANAVIQRHYRAIAGKAVSSGGLVLSMFSFGISPRPAIGAILIATVLLHLLFRRLAARTKLPHSWGAVRDAVGRQPIRLAIVRIFDHEFNKLLETSVTDRYGRYRFLVGKNIYYVTAEKPTYAQARSADVDLTTREGVVGIDFQLEREDDRGPGIEGRIPDTPTPEEPLQGASETGVALAVPAPPPVEAPPWAAVSPVSPPEPPASPFELPTTTELAAMIPDPGSPSDGVAAPPKPAMPPASSPNSELPTSPPPL